MKREDVKLGMRAYWRDPAERSIGGKARSGRVTVVGWTRSPVSFENNRGIVVRLEDGSEDVALAEELEPLGDA
jgi:hypothetical protein